MPDQVRKSMKESRRNRLMRIQQEIAFSEAEEMIGKTLPVMVEGRLPEERMVYAGRSPMDAPDVDGLVFFESQYDLLTGTIVPVRITASSGYDLIGELAE